MKSRYVVPSFLLAGLIGLASPVATASDEFVGALFGAGAGAVIGHAVGGHDGAVVGGVLGAVVGASVADDDHYRVVHHRPRPYVVYGPPPARYYSAPYRNGPRHGYQHRHHERNDWRDNRGHRSDDPWRYQDW